ncbi:hypothetical protein KPL76_07160 [Subtercola sp. PAMC28395]|uniref:hypothetical protein n=1 Tax=Subtercola sp. PAMC28395 TaxID=2846775 RepID=UPI001C0C4001|nr:hypothetical protein [Subtercola sp. PAMC28395]QWT25115.1 hypothetical protein KPL76_07160 [Subtercola sp. PAMC28395]
MSRDMGKRIDHIVTRPMPISLTPEELDLENHPIKRASSVIPVRAWTRFYEATVRVDAEAFEWTDKAVHIRWVGSDGQPRSAWYGRMQLTERDRSVSNNVVAE